MARVAFIFHVVPHPRALVGADAAVQVAAVEQHDLSIAVELHGADRYFGVHSAIAQLHLEHDDLTTVRIDQDLVHVAELTAIQSDDVPAPDVGLAVRKVVAVEIVQRYERSRHVRRRPDAGTVAFGPILSLSHGKPPAGWPQRRTPAA